MFEVAFGARTMPLAFPAGILTARAERSEPPRPGPETAERTVGGCFGRLGTIDEMVVTGLAASRANVYDEP
jgi:hypothetical protein